jgi:hypothetical protein
VWTETPDGPGEETPASHLEKGLVFSLHSNIFPTREDGGRHGHGNAIPKELNNVLAKPFSHYYYDYVNNYQRLAARESAPQSAAMRRLTVTAVARCRCGRAYSPRE